MKVLRCTDCTKRCIIPYSNDLPTLCLFNIYDDPQFEEVELTEEEILKWFDNERICKEWMKKTDV